MRFVETNQNIMKTLTTLLTGVLLLASTMAHATIRRVNNALALATTCNTCYTSLQAAIDAAIDGDTIHLEPSDVSYGSIGFGNNPDLTKPLVILGPGYKLEGVNGNDSLQADSKTATVGLLVMNDGSQGSVISGLRFEGQGGTGAIGIEIKNTSDITITRNFFDGVIFRFPATGSACSNIEISGNYFNRLSGNIDGGASIGQNLTAITIRNNYLSGQILLNNVNDQVSNMVILYNTLDYDGVHAVKNAEVAYNVFHQGSIAGSDLEIHDNISTDVLPAGTNNDMVSMGEVYDLGVESDDGKWDILNASPYDESSATPRGMFGGISPYKLSGIPAIPSIYLRQSTLSTTPDGSVNVTLSTRSNN
jgi:hypothetical protein